MSAPTKQAVMEALYQKSAYCEKCGWGEFDPCSDCREVLGDCADAMLTLLAAHPAEPAPLANRERVAEALREAADIHPTSILPGWFGHAANALLAADVFRDEATVKAELAKRIAQAIEAEGAEDDRDEGDDFHRTTRFATCAQLAREIGGAS